MGDDGVFADTCIFLSYAYIFEDFSEHSEKLFCSGKYNIYTSETVKEEIKTRRDRRNKAYSLFLTSLSNGENLDEITTRLGMYLTPNDLGHFRALRNYLITYGSLIDILAEFRRWKLISEKRFKKAENDLSGIVAKCGDAYTKDLIKSIIDNDSDSKIIIETFEWSKSVPAPKFVTIDSTDIYKNGSDILNKLVDFKFLDEEPFRILHILELDYT
jgi:hypothetical protein